MSSNVPNDKGCTAPSTAPPAPPDVKEVQAVLEYDRTKVAEFITRIKKTLDGYDWLITSREFRRASESIREDLGSYSWNDDRWHDEPLERIAADWSNCPKTEAEVKVARQRGGEWLPQNQCPPLSGYYWMLRHDGTVVPVSFDRERDEFETTNFKIYEFGSEIEYLYCDYRFWSERIAPPSLPATGIKHKAIDYPELLSMAERGGSSAVVCCNDHCRAKEQGDLRQLLSSASPQRSAHFKTFGHVVVHDSGGKIHFTNARDEHALRGLNLVKVVQV